MYDLRRLSLLVELKRRGTIAAVGKSLHYSPSGVSQQLSILESEVGEKLLTRVGRHVRLTAAGELLCKHAEVIRTEVERAEAAMAGLHGAVRGTVRFAAFQSCNLAYMPALLSRFAGTEVAIEMSQLEPERSLPALRDHRFDIVISEHFSSAELDQPQDLSSELLLREQMYLAHDGTATTLSDCAEAKWVLEPKGTVSRGWAVGVCRKAGFEPIVPFEADDLITHLALVRSGGAVALIPELLRTVAPMDGIHLEPLSGEYRYLSITTRADSPDYPAVGAVIACLRDLASTTGSQLPSELDSSR